MVVLYSPLYLPSVRIIRQGALSGYKPQCGYKVRERIIQCRSIYIGIR